jgi:starch-binding outer membrane protein, SusD/RagB family
MKKYLICIGFLALLTSCSDVLDKHDINGIDQVFTDEALSKAYLDKLYFDNLLPWTTSYAPLSDETFGGDVYMYGTLTAESVGDFGTTNYTKIRNINILLDELEKSPLAEEVKAPLMAQAYVLRAVRYFELVKLYGGVPMILEPQDPFTEDVNVSRDKTSACFEQIVSDLEQGSILPATWGSIDQGRITRGAALALKGRVLMYYASPQFNPTNDLVRWQVAYEANKAALDTLTQDGYALHNNFAKLWFEEGNKEAIFVTRYNTSDFTNAWDRSTRPRSAGNSAGGSNQPTLQLVNAFPMKSGLPIDDVASGYDPILFWKDRDPRFAATIAYNGVTWPLNGVSTRKQWTFNNNKWEGSNNTKSGFYCRKAVNETYAIDVTDKSGTDWIELRLAEVLLNLAECANAIGRTAEDQEAYAGLIAVRKRAGIEAGVDNLYGLQAGMTSDQIFEAIVRERQIEFAFESKRYWDLRRWHMFDRLNGTVREGIKVNLIGITPDAFKAGVDNGSIVVTDANYATYFTHEVIVLDTKGPINYLDNYYFYAIQKTNLDKNPNLKQTMGWDGGTFNPLE